MDENCIIDAVLITGGNGCLGRFIVDLLLKTRPSIKAIRILDNNVTGKTFFDEHYGCSARLSGTSIEYIVADIRNTTAIRRAVQGINCVFHTANVVDISAFPDDSLMWSVNCRGTQNLLEACYENDVKYFIYTSSVNAVLGADFHAIENVSEAEMKKPHRWFWGGYGETKWFAEQIAIDANGIALPKGGTLKSVVLRPTSFYGENDYINVTRCLRIAKQCGDTLYQIGKDEMVMQQTYVGNVAAAHVAAMRALIRNPEKCGGQAFFITDNTPLMNPFQLAGQFLEGQGMRLAGFKVPYIIAYYIVLLLIYLLQLAKRFFPAWKLEKNFPIPSSAQLRFLSMKCSFARDEAEECLGYQPLFTFEESLRRSREFYENVSLDNTGTATETHMNSSSNVTTSNGNG